jgi:hypothetical protein
MTRGTQAHHSSTLVLSLLMAIIGVALIVENIGADGSVISPRMLLGILFVAAGVGRTYVELRRGRGT